MIKIFLTVRNRLGITKKCIEAIQKHTITPYQIYIYDNQSNYKIDEHFKYFGRLYSKGIISQVTFTTTASTFNAFSKASTCNFFGKQHQQDPNKDSYDFLLMLDNDIILTPGWDEHVLRSWKFVRKNGLSNIKVIGQLPGGIKNFLQDYDIPPDIRGRAGALGGSGLWTVRPNFFDDVGFLDLKQLVGQNKKHDQLYWQLMHRSTQNKPYIMGINKKLGIHCGTMAGSVCNTLTRNRNIKSFDCINFADSDEKIEKMKFDEFFNLIFNNKVMLNDW